MSRKYALPMILLVICFAAPGVLADSTSFTGTFANPEQTFTTTLTVSAPAAVTLQTWGFGGGTNADGEIIPAGGFDPLLAVFSGTGAGATILTDSMGNAIATSDLLSNYGSYTGCSPAGEVNIGGDVCGDITMSLSLAAGTYTVLLSDAGYIPDAVFDNGALGEGFSDLTSGVFQTCNTVGSSTTCQDDTGNWALDILAPHTVTTTPPATPEPMTLMLLGGGLFGVGVHRRRRKARFEV